MCHIRGGYRQFRKQSEEKRKEYDVKRPLVISAVIGLAIIAAGICVGASVTADGNGEETIEGTEMQVSFEAETIFGLLQMEFRQREYDGTDDIFREVEVSTPFWAGDIEVEPDDVWINVLFEEVGGNREVPVFAAAVMEPPYPAAVLCTWTSKEL